MARDQAWTSGRIEWARNSNTVLPQVKSQFFSFEGEYWAKGATPYTRPDGIEEWIRPRISSYPAAWLYKQPPVPPVWAGAIFKREAASWIQHNMDRFTLVGDEIVHAVPTKILEAQLYNSKEMIPFIESGHPTTRGFAGRVRLYIAPTLGHALPRLDGFGSAQLLQRVDQTEFKEYAPGLFIPRKIDVAQVGWRNSKEPNLDATAPHAAHTWYELLQVTLVNQPIPKSDFEVPLPVSKKP